MTNRQLAIPNRILSRVSSGLSNVKIGVGRSGRGYESDVFTESKGLVASPTTLKLSADKPLAGFQRFNLVIYFASTIFRFNCNCVSKFDENP